MAAKQWRKRSWPTCIAMAAPHKWHLLSILLPVKPSHSCRPAGRYFERDKPSARRDDNHGAVKMLWPTKSPKTTPPEAKRLLVKPLARARRSLKPRRAFFGLPRGAMTPSALRRHLFLRARLSGWPIARKRLYECKCRAQSAPADLACGLSSVCLAPPKIADEIRQSRVSNRAKSIGASCNSALLPGNARGGNLCRKAVTPPPLLMLKVCRSYDNGSMNACCG